MRAITLRPSGPATAQAPLLTGQLAEGWHEVPLAGYAQLKSAKSVRARIIATAALCGLPAEPLIEDSGIFGAIVRAAPWLFSGPLPEKMNRDVLTHLGQQYRYVGDLHRISAEQLEALLNFLQEHKEAPLLSAPSLLAVLYCPVNGIQDADSVEAAAAAFATLPVSDAWPVLLDFLRSGAPAALHIRNSSAVLNSTRQLLQIL